jgi:Plasmid pRiA4b ORF-3-like protein
VPASSEPNVYGIRIALLDYQPEIWRRLLVPAAVSLDQFHMVLQEAMGWTNSHLHQFLIGDSRYGMHADDWADDELDEAEYQLSGVARGGDRFVYVYDFGDSWEHEVLVERASSTRPPLKCAVCLDGANACPPEDCGGPGGYGGLLEALADPAHEDHEDLLMWAGAQFDPAAFDLAAANAALQRLRLYSRMTRRRE